MDVTALLLGVIGALLVGVMVLLLRPRARGDATGILGSLDSEVRRISERLARLERVPEVQAHDSERLVRLEPVTQAVAELQARVAELQSVARSREELERRTAESIRRLELVLAGTQSRGAAGEALLDTLFARLPGEWQVRDFRVGNRVVEFGLRLPNDLILPIDSKWSGVELIERLGSTDDPAERVTIRRQVETTVRERAREVTKYIDPDITASYGVAVVPDAVFELCAPLQAEALGMKVVLVSHSLFVPYLLMVFQSTLASGQTIDAQKLSAYLDTTSSSLDEIQKELHGRLSRAIRMLTNSREAIGAHASRARSGLVGLRVASGDQPEALPAADIVLDDEDDGDDELDLVRYLDTRVSQ